MKDTWSLDALYKGFDDPQFLKDSETMKLLVQEINALPVTLSHNHEEQGILAILEKEEAFQVLTSKLGSYISLRQATDTSNAETVALMGRLEQIASEATKAFTACDKFIADCEDLETWIAHNEVLTEYAYVLRETKKDGSHRLSEEVEEVIAKMNTSAGNAWENLQEYLTSTLTLEYEGEQKTLSELRNMAYDPNPSVRKKAFEAECAAYESIKEPVAFALNNIKSQVNTICELRGFSSPLDMTLHYSRMKQETLDAMLASMKEYMPHFQKYLKHKASLLGYEHGLPWYDLFAPLEGNQKKFTIETAKTYLLDHFRPFADDLADLIETAFDNAWIDFYPRKGKVGGAFCANLSVIKQSRVLTNFDGSLGDVVTLAHELGHAYHGFMIEDHRPLNTDYSMPVAETASTFNENIIMNAAIDEEQDPKAKAALIENQLQDLTQIICDIYSRFLFEKAVFEQRKSSTFLFADRLCEMMMDAQKEAYGDAIDPTTLHPFMWINKSHYYSASLSFYNFPYAFGGLFARGLVAQYEKEGASFVPKYRSMLKATTVSSVEDVARMAGIDLTKKEFWDESLTTCVKRINEFIDLTKGS